MKRDDILHLFIQNKFDFLQDTLENKPYESLKNKEKFILAKIKFEQNEIKTGIKMMKNLFKTTKNIKYGYYIGLFYLQIQDFESQKLKWQKILKEKSRNNFYDKIITILLDENFSKILNLISEDLSISKLYCLFETCFVYKIKKGIKKVVRIFIKQNITCYKILVYLIYKKFFKKEYQTVITYFEEINSNCKFNNFEIELIYIRCLILTKQYSKSKSYIFKLREKENDNKKISKLCFETGYS